MSREDTKEQMENASEEDNTVALDNNNNSPTEVIDALREGTIGDSVISTANQLTVAGSKSASVVRIEAPEISAVIGRTSVVGRQIKKSTRKHSRARVRPVEPGLPQFRYDLVEVMESKGFQSTILALIVLDMALVITEIALDSTRYCNEEGHLEFPNEHYHEVVEVFHYTSLGIVSFFLLELLLLMFGLGAVFWRRIIYVVDFVIVLAAFIVEIFLEDIFATFIILFRLWRMVRVMHGIYVSVEENRMRKIDKLKDKQHDLKHQIRDLTEEHMRLVLLLQEHHIQYERVQ
jgi:cell division protein FtsB